jgi:HSP20 family molecular chaperone IbpA
MVSVFSFNAYTQTREELIEEFMKERRKMMKQMVQMFQDDFNQDDFFKDDIAPFGKQKSYKSSGSSVEIQEKYEEDGSISIIIIPKRENMALDIQTKDGMITIKSEMKVEEESQTGKKSFKTYSSSSFSRSISIPSGYKAKTPKAEGKGIKISLVSTKKVKSILKKANQKPTKKFHPKRIPIGKQPGEEAI